MKLRGWEPVLVLALVALFWWGTHAQAPPEPAASSTSLWPHKKPQVSATAELKPTEDQWERYMLIHAASDNNQVEVAAFLLVEDKGTWYGATVTTPNEPPGMKNTNLWRKDP